MPPRLVDFAITRRCNLRCSHCYADSTDSAHPEELTTAEAMRLITEIAAMGVQSIVFNGGEPLLRNDIYQLVNHAHTARLAPLINTNGTLLSTETATRLKNAGLRMITISLKGPDPQSHTEVCGVQGNWDRCLAAMRNTSAVGLPHRLNTLITHETATRVSDFVSLARRTKAETLEFSRFVPAGRGKDNIGMMLTSHEEQRVIAQIISHQVAGGDLRYRCIAIPQFWTAATKNSGNKTNGNLEISACGAGLDRCSVTYDGSVFPCPLLHKKAGNVRQSSLREIWQQSEVLKKLRDRDKLEKKCGKCANRHDCGGARCLLFGETGSITKSPDCEWFCKGDPPAASDMVAK